ncbi:MAG: nucleoside monophosphate kinase [Desulfurococcaceae archaeon]
MKAVLLGPPGAGKGTFAKYFSQKYCIPHISTGDIFRFEISRGSEVGLKVKEYIERGLLVPDEIAIEVIKRRLSQADVARGFILDGFPRTIGQARALEDITRVDVAIYIYLPVEIAIERLSSRFICPKCGAIYNLVYNSPKEDLKCDHDGETLVRRRDDEPDVVRERYRVYYQTFSSVIEFYRERGLLVEVDNSIGSDRAIPMLESLLKEKGVLILKECAEVN